MKAALEELTDFGLGLFSGWLIAPGVILLALGIADDSVAPALSGALFTVGGGILAALAACRAWDRAARPRADGMAETLPPLSPESDDRRNLS